uniref:Uncharacterized protein n=1 Tax=Panthera leo TaxID=9689 RepID=A0A8C8XGE7_PANLE
MVAVLEVEVGGVLPGNRSWKRLICQTSPQRSSGGLSTRVYTEYCGHEAMHTEMILILMATLVVAQLLLVQWKQTLLQPQG